ncbi:nitroreductase family protein [Pontibacter akesuensis]|uniref:Putative NAD(P)H nitroreductase n=1 Tax=Pontibacter akesuensis TaxID=388950 RepID=A0A1I7GUW6_9BACT|nr:nitroreductase [Pontibacter akesuensis]GHA54946.1 NAD(P)H nitroreductase [Pontibacter akesuensis]SFU52205.1 Nitroreductase [Pontibacter akesuensis]
MNNQFQSIKEVILTRRTTKPQQMNGQVIPDALVEQLLQLADWAPTHGHTEPWRFIVYAGDSVKEFCRQHADLYQHNCSADKFQQAKYEKLLHMGDTASHILVSYMRRGDLPKIPELEEIAATSCAIQNLLLGANALGMASYWGSGGMAYHPSMKKMLGLRDEDLVLGILYLGYADKSAGEGKRQVPLAQKVTWHR